MRRNPTAFRERFNRWKNGKDIKEIYNAGRISDQQYVDIMENVARNNWKEWGDRSEDAALLRILNDNTYDYRGFYNKYPPSEGNYKDHWTDEFKTVYHPSFSNESRYSGKKSQFNPFGRPGGIWHGEFFTPQWYQQNPNGYGFYSDGYPRGHGMPKFEEGKDQQTYYGGELPEIVVTPTHYEDPVPKSSSFPSIKDTFSQAFQYNMLKDSGLMDDEDDV